MAAALETVTVAASPGVLYLVLRLRGMAPAQTPDPSMHTTFIIDPSDIFARYHSLFAPSSGMREAARVGFLIPARVSYLLFGSVSGFFVFRYLLALVAIVPVYLLLKKLYGRWAGLVGIAVVMSSPVVITAWGTDYPDSAAVSYLTGGLAALALCWGGRRWRSGWLIAAGALLTMAVWSHGASVPLVIVSVAVYLGLRLWCEQRQVGRDVALLVATAIVVTGLFAVCSKLLFGQFNFISPTVRSAMDLSRASALRANHSASWDWAPYDPYLLVPPAIVAAYFVVFVRRRRTVGASQLFVGLTGALQLATFVLLQFVGSLQTLEMHYFSSMLWSSVNIMLAMTVVEVAHPFLGRGVANFARGIAGAVPTLLVLVVALAYEAAYQVGLSVPAMTWAPWGAVLAAIIVAGAVVGRLTSRLVSAAAVVLMISASLILTVAPPSPHTLPANTVFDPRPSYAKALGGNDSAYVAEYAVAPELPRFVGRAAYPGEVLLTWEPSDEFGELQGPMGIYHNRLTWVSSTFPVLRPNGVRRVERLHPGQVLIMSLTGHDVAQAMQSLASFQPTVVRRAILSDGWYHLHVWLVDLGRYLHVL